MSQNAWLPLNLGEKELLIEVLGSSRKAKSSRSGAIDALLSKLIQAKSYPQITVEVQGGLVQCVSGNPFPIRICDYDVEGQDEVDIDERGDPCRMWFEPAESEIYSSSEQSGSSLSLNR
jgi:hypothetical protein